MLVFKHNGKYLSKAEYLRAKRLELFKPKIKKVKIEKRRRRPKKLTLPKPKKVYSSYNEYLKSPEWAKKRKRILKRAKYKCEICKIARAFQVHHKTYKRIFNEKDTDLIAVCGICHQEKHKILSDDYVEKRVNEMMKYEGYK